MEGRVRVLLAKAYYPYTSNQRPASHARALSGAAASIPDPALSVSLRSSLGSGCARTASPRAARLLHVPVRWAAQDGGCRKKAHRWGAPPELGYFGKRTVLTTPCPPNPLLRYFLVVFINQEKASRTQASSHIRPADCVLVKLQRQTCSVRHGLQSLNFCNLQTVSPRALPMREAWG
jgi:hypothetical protein